MHHQQQDVTVQIPPSQQTAAIESPSCPPWQSKTLWAAVLTAALPLIPGVGPVISGLVGTNPEIATAIIGAIFGGLRLISHAKIQIK